MAYRITPAHSEKAKVQIEFEAEDGTIHTLNVRKWHYRPKAVVLESLKWVTEQEALVKSGERKDEPTDLDLMVFTLGLVQPDLAPIVEQLSLGEQFEIWQAWTGAITADDTDTSGATAAPADEAPEAS
ncbi:hypothetical protein 7S6_11 [uncultured Caudovirales phage]|uniref:Tail assembly chaperone n=1 Tax=uncultured Caudovirales phage TaxID=2100421 RepID=A0A2H4JC67_9CAUD|nr:hypothetical protein 7S6_11 [uncultured Caudovirales phage]